jgi:peptidoglycan-associated lipoprotein
MRFTQVTAIVTVAVLGCACHGRRPTTAPTHPEVPPTVPARPPAPPPPPSPAAAPPRALTPQEEFNRESLAQLNADHPLADAFFDLDQSTLRDDARRALQQDAAWLAKWPSTKIMVEGHCDERGTAEYNLALGDKRARQVTAYLENLGVSSSRIVMESLGKESPFCSGTGESCWAQNRRGHFVITAK